MAPRPESPNFHERLDIDPEASPDEIKKAFRTLSKEYHPDVGGDEEMFKSILEAKEVLTGERSEPIIRPSADAYYADTPEESVEEPEVNPNPTEHEPANNESEGDVAERINQLREELKEVEPGHEDPVPPDREPPRDEGEGGGDGERSNPTRAAGWSEWGTDYEPCPTCHKSWKFFFLRVLFRHCPQCGGSGSIPKRTWHRSGN